MWLVDADDVSVDNGTVTFDADDDGDFDADLSDAANIITVNNAAVPATNKRAEIEVEDGELELVVRTTGAGEFVVLVAATDDGDEPELDNDGAPEEDFGVTGTTVSQDVEGIVFLDADLTLDAADRVIGVSPAATTRTEETTINVTAVLFDNPNPLADDPATPLVGGDTIDGVNATGDDAVSIVWFKPIPAGTAATTATATTISSYDADTNRLIVQAEPADAVPADGLTDQDDVSEAFFWRVQFTSDDLFFDGTDGQTFRQFRAAQQLGPDLYVRCFFSAPGRGV